MTAVDRAGRRPLARADANFALRIIIILIIITGVLIIAPLIYAAWISTHDTNVILRRSMFIGLGHYRRILASDEAVEAMIRSFEFTAFAVVASIVLGLVMALVLNEEFPGRRFLRAAILLPWAVSEVATATAWIFILNPTFGALTGLLSPLGLISAEPCLDRREYGALWVALAFVWHVTPLGAFFFLAALQTVPDSLYQAARIDRASAVKSLLPCYLAASALDHPRRPCSGDGGGLPQLRHPVRHDARRTGHRIADLSDADLPLHVRVLEIRPRRRRQLHPSRDRHGHHHALFRRADAPAAAGEVARRRATETRFDDGRGDRV